MHKRIFGLYPTFFRSYGVGYACQSIFDIFFEAGANVRLFCIAVDDSCSRSYFRPTLSAAFQSIGFRLFSVDILTRFVQWRYLRCLLRRDVAYIWPGTSLDLFISAKSKGCYVVAENINTHQATSKLILDCEYVRLGLVPTHGIDYYKVADENEKLRYVDFVFSPSEEVTKSLRAADVPGDKIIKTSYGLSAADIIILDVSDKHLRGLGEFTAIFVGRIGIRKGVHLLLDYWVKSAIQGTLKLIGNIEADARHLIEPYLSRPDIQHIGFCNDLKPHYRDADLFIFPSLEEGSPLVTYLSLGAGLPSLVSPMGGGGIIRDGIDGRVIDPHDEGQWIEAIRTLAGNQDLCRRYGENAHNHAQDYLWEKVGRQRLEELNRRIAARDGR